MSNSTNSNSNNQIRLVYYVGRQRPLRRHPRRQPRPASVSARECGFTIPGKIRLWSFWPRPGV